MEDLRQIRNSTIVQGMEQTPPGVAYNLRICERAAIWPMEFFNLRWNWALWPAEWRSMSPLSSQSTAALRTLAALSALCISARRNGVCINLPLDILAMSCSYPGDISSKQETITAKYGLHLLN